MGDISDLLPMDYDAAEEAAKPDTFEPIPAGDYQVMVENAEIVTTKSLTGKMLKLTLQVCGGQYDGRLVWDQLLLQHESEKAVNLGRQRLAKLIVAANVPGNDTQELIGKMVMAHVVIGKGTEKYGPNNEVKGYAALGAAPAAPAKKATTEQPSDIPGVTKRTVYASGDAISDDDLPPF